MAVMKTARARVRAVVENRDIAVRSWVTNSEQVKGHRSLLVARSLLGHKLLHLSQVRFRYSVGD